jgi:hypothetical protein
MKKIDEIWRSLETDNTVINGVGIRRYSGTILPDVFCCGKRSGKG